MTRALGGDWSTARKERPNMYESPDPEAFAKRITFGVGWSTAPLATAFCLGTKANAHLPTSLLSRDVCPTSLFAHLCPRSSGLSDSPRWGSGHQSCLHGEMAMGQ